MIRVVDRHNRHLHTDTLDQMFRLRHEVFVREKGWTDLEKDQVYEKDQYDTDDAIYMIAMDNKDLNRVIGCYRLFPTTLPHMLSEVFPHIVEEALPRRPDVLELTRLALVKSERRGRAYFEIMSSLQEYGLRAGLTGYTSIIRTIRMPIIQAAGTSLTPLGLPRDMEGESFVPVLFEVSEQNLAKNLKSGGLVGSVFDLETPIRKVA